MGKTQSYQCLLLPIPLVQEDLLQMTSHPPAQLKSSKLSSKRARPVVRLVSFGGAILAGNGTILPALGLAPQTMLAQLQH